MRVCSRGCVCLREDNKRNDSLRENVKAKRKRVRERERERERERREREGGRERARRIKLNVLLIMGCLVMDVCEVGQKKE